MNIYYSNTYREDLTWLHFDAEPKILKRKQVKDQQSYVSAFVTYLKIPSSS